MAQPKKRRPGRPPKPAGEPRAVPVTVSLLDADIRALRAIAERQGVSMSGLVQRAVTRWLRSKEAQA